MITSIALTVSLLPAAQSAPLKIDFGGVSQGVRPLAYAAAPTGSKFVATLENNKVRIINGNTHMTVKEMSGHPQPAYAAAWSPNGKWIATGDESARVIVWDASTGQKIRTLRDHTKGIQSLAFNATSTALISTGKDDALNVYSLPTFKKTRTILGKGVNLYGGVFMGRTSNILLGTLGKGAAIYNTAGSQLWAFGGHGGQGALEAATNPTCTLVVSAGKDGIASVWNAKNKQRIGNLNGHTDWVMHVAFTPNGRYIATSSVDGTVRLWDAVTLRKAAIVQFQTAVGSPIAFTADGKYLISVSVDDYLQYNRLTPTQAGKGAAPKRGRRTWAR